MALATGALIASPRAQAQSAQSTEQTFEIPAQPLEAALQQLGREAQIDILYENGVVEQRPSTRVSGRLSPQEALARLLMGTGLTYRFTSANGALVFPPERPPLALAEPGDGSEGAPRMVLDVMRVRATPIVGGRPSRSFTVFGTAVTRQINRSLSSDPLLMARTFSAELAVSIGPDGTVSEGRMSRTSADREVDARILDIVRAMRFEAPPHDLPQPIRIELVGR